MRTPDIPAIILDANIVIGAFSKGHQQERCKEILHLARNNRGTIGVIAEIKREILSGRATMELLPAGLEEIEVDWNPEVLSEIQKGLMLVSAAPGLYVTGRGKPPGEEDLKLAHAPQNDGMLIVVSNDRPLHLYFNEVLRPNVSYDMVEAETFHYLYVKMQPQPRGKAKPVLHLPGQESRKSLATKFQASLDVEVDPMPTLNQGPCGHASARTQLYKFRPLSFCPDCQQTTYKPDVVSWVGKFGLHRRYWNKKAARKTCTVVEVYDNHGMNVAILNRDRGSKYAFIATSRGVFRLTKMDDCKYSFGDANLQVGEEVCFETNGYYAAKLLNHLAGDDSKDANYLATQRFPLDGLVNPELLPKIKEHRFVPLSDRLTTAQRNAVHMANNVPERGLMLVHGPPGTGKTFTAAQLVANLLQQDFRVLVLGRTRHAIGNVMAQISDTHPELANRCISYTSVPEYLAKQVPVSPMVGKTLDTYAMGAEAAFMSTARLLTDFDYQGKCEWDYIILEESGQIQLPELAAARSLGKRLILFGDPEQLPPQVYEEGAASEPELILSISERLLRHRPDLVATLDLQFRSVPGMMDWSNHVHYDNKLADHRTDTATAFQFDAHEVIGPLTWIDTAHTPHETQLDGQAVRDAAHLRVALRLLKQLLEQGWNADEIGYLAGITQQVKAFKKLVGDQLGKHVANQIGCGTIDQFQGHEREIIIFDTTVRIPHKIHDSPQRLNVAMTRAKQHLVVIGSRSMAKSPSDHLLLWAWQNYQGWNVIEGVKP